MECHNNDLYVLKVPGNSHDSFRAHGRVSGPISKMLITKNVNCLGNRHSTAGNWCPTSHLASLARRRGPWYPVGWWRSVHDSVSPVLACMTSYRAKLVSDS